jgi:hypothetical protein
VALENSLSIYLGYLLSKLGYISNTNTVFCYSRFVSTSKHCSDLHPSSQLWHRKVAQIGKLYISILVLYFCVPTSEHHLLPLFAYHELQNENQRARETQDERETTWAGSYFAFQPERRGLVCRTTIRGRRPEGLGSWGEAECAGSRRTLDGRKGPIQPTRRGHTVWSDQPGIFTELEGYSSCTGP